jgi:hypothetical protein
MSERNRARRALELWMACGLIAGLSACDDTPSAPRESAGSVLDLSQALQSAVASCAETARSCQEAADAAGSDDSCRESFDSCRDAAQESAKPALESAVHSCTEAAKSCRENATTDDATAACKDQLGTCIGATKADAGGNPDKPEEQPDAGSKSPVAPCIDALHTCIEGDQPARTCTTALQECIAETVGHNGNGPDNDAGKPDNDAGKPDAGKPDNDAGKPDNTGKPDAGKPDNDAGTPALPDAATGGGKPDQTPHADAGKPDPGPADAGAADSSKDCKEAREACLANGEDKEACARMQRACRDR